MSPVTSANIVNTDDGRGGGRSFRAIMRSISRPAGERLGPPVLRDGSRRLDAKSLHVLSAFAAELGDKSQAQGRVRARHRTYAKGIKISKAQMRSLDVRGGTFHPEWSYTVHPTLPKS